MSARAFFKYADTRFYVYFYQSILKQIYIYSPICVLVVYNQKSEASVFVVGGLCLASHFPSHRTRQGRHSLRMKMT